MLWWLLGAAIAAPQCENIRFRDIVSIPAPAVIVLGERHGHQPDLRRADRVVTRLSRRGEVTLALEAVHHRMQPVLDRFAAGDLDAADLPGLLDWNASWGFAWRPYAPVVTAAVQGVAVVAAGLDLGPKPEDRDVPVPPRYIDLLRDAMQGHDMPLEMEARFVTSMAWRDFGIAEHALKAWDGQGHLVILAGRGHVEGGKGIAWQVAQQVEVPVHGFVLARGKDAPCYPGDRLWR